MDRDVICYAGASYPERPLAFLHRGQRLEVVEVERRERTPRQVRFFVRTADDQRFLLIYDQPSDSWDVRPGRRVPPLGGAQ